MAEADCMPTFYMTTESIFEKMVKHDEEDDDNAKPFYETINNNCFVDAMDYYDAYERRRCKWFKLFNFTEVIKCTDKDLSKYMRRTKNWMRWTSLIALKFKKSLRTNKLYLFF